VPGADAAKSFPREEATVHADGEAADVPITAKLIGDLLGAFLVMWLVWELFSGYGETQIALFNSVDQPEPEQNGEIAKRRLYDAGEARDRFRDRERRRRTKGTVIFLAAYAVAIVVIAVYLFRLAKN